MAQGGEYIFVLIIPQQTKFESAMWELLCTSVGLLVCMSMIKSSKCFNVAQSWCKCCPSVKELGSGWDAELLGDSSGSKLFAYGTIVVLDGLRVNVDIQSRKLYNLLIEPFFSQDITFFFFNGNCCNWNEILFDSAKCLSYSIKKKYNQYRENC